MAKRKEIAGQSKHILNIVKSIISSHNLDYLDYHDILFVRVNMVIANKKCEIFRVASSLIPIFGCYYIVEVYPNFDLDETYMQYREIYHCLKHIPREYKRENRILPHDYESFYGEHLFTAQTVDGVNMIDPRRIDLNG